MKILITGVAGFIGSNLARLLLNNRLNIIGIDKLTSYYDIKQKRNNLADLQKYENFSFYENDIQSEITIKLIEESDLIVHLAAQPGVFKSWGKDFNVYVNENILATQFILEILKKYPEKKLIFASSSSVYGNTNQYPMEEKNILNPISPYGLTKLTCEKMLELYHFNYGINYLALRFFTVFGPSQRPDMAFHKFFKAIIDKTPISIYGDGKQERDFTYIGDIINFILNLIKTDHDWNASINVGGGHIINVNEVIDLIFKITNLKTNVTHIEDQKGDMRKTYANIELAKNKFNYKPQYSLEEGLKLQWEWIEKYYSLNK